MLTDHDEPLTLPREPAAPARPPVPVVASVAPVVGAGILWLVTGSSFALWFALLGPVLLIASLVDGWRSARRHARRAGREHTEALAAVTQRVHAHHERERAARWALTPDAGGYLDRPHEVWRSVPGRAGVLVVGRGDGASDLRLDGGDDAAARALRRAARTIGDVPVTVPLTAGIAVSGPPVIASAVQRALVAQACATNPPDVLRVVEGGEPWLAILPHRHSSTGTVLAALDGGRPVPDDVDVPIVRIAPDAPPPPRCAAVLTITGPGTARLDHDGVAHDVRVETLSAAQAHEFALLLAGRATASLGRRGDPPLTLDELEPAPPGEADRATLAAAIGVSGGERVVLDLVGDGPHAVVIGTTGAGKSELLTTWIVALCRGRTPQEVSFLLVDFKGGRTFDALARLPHVTGVLTDLDDATALRAVQSLRAEIRHREAVLARLGVRDIAEAAGELGRLVVVVDEYAALVAAHPELHELFGDLAARGRALGVHLVLASQRAAGAFRDAVLANAGLRIALRVRDAADSRTVLGSDRATALPGSPEARGIALVRRAADGTAFPVRVARTTEASIASARSDGAAPARRPWLPALPSHVPLAALRGAAASASPTDEAASAVAGDLVLGLGDEPDRQRQRPVVLPDGEPGLVVVGAAGSGRTTALRTIAAQAAVALWVPSEPEAGWDVVAALDGDGGVGEIGVGAGGVGGAGRVGGIPAGAVVLCDDADALLARLPPEYAAEVAERLERCAREARTRGIRLVLSAQRLGGALGRVADLLPRRAILAMPSRADHVAAGGESAHFVADAPPGRARLGGLLLQVADPGLGAGEANGIPADTRVWAPGRRPAAFVAPGGAATRALLAAWQDGGARTVPLSTPGAALSPGSVVWGTPEEWLAQWRPLAEARAEADLVVDAACAAEYRAITGRRDLPPYAAAGIRSAWLHRPDGSAPRRVRLVARGRAGR